MDYRFINHARKALSLRRPAVIRICSRFQISTGLKVCAVYFGGGAEDMGFEKLRLQFKTAEAEHRKRSPLFAPAKGSSPMFGAQSMGKSHEHEPCGREK